MSERARLVDPRSNDGRPDAAAYLVAGSASLLPTLAVPILYGRDLDDVDISSAAPVAVVSESLARTLFLSENSVGKSVHLTLPEGAPQSRKAQEVTIVGIAGDTDTGTIYGRALGVVYVPLDPTVSGRLTIVAHTSGRPDPLIPHLRDQLNRVDPELAVERMVSGREALAGMFSLVATFGALVKTLTWLTALVSLVGLYGLVTWLVTSSRREIGVRLAVGASGNSVFRSVLMTGLRPVIVGLGVGVPLGLVGRGALGAAYDLPLRASEVSLLVAAVVTLCAAALIACLPAARSAAATDACCLLRDAR